MANSDSADIEAHRRGGVIGCRHLTCPDRVQPPASNLLAQLGAAAAWPEAFRPPVVEEAEHGLVLSQREDPSAEFRHHRKRSQLRGDVVGGSKGRHYD